MFGARGLLAGSLKRIIPQHLRDWSHNINYTQYYYRRNMGRRPSIFRPTRYSEKMHWRKLFESSALFTNLSDKIAVRDYISEKGFASLLVPQLWVGDDPSKIPFAHLPGSFVIKSTHASAQYIIVREGQKPDIAAITIQARRWLDFCLGAAQREPGYLHVPHRLVIEPLLVCDNQQQPNELRVFVFDGVAKFVQLQSVTHQRQYKVAYMNRDWQQLTWQARAERLLDPEKPAAFDFAVKVAERVGSGLDHCRVDFYLKDEQLYIGEITLYSWSGIVVHKPDEADLIMGSYWNLRWPLTRAAITIATRRWGHHSRAHAGTRSPGILRGKVDGCDGVKVWGWAQSQGDPHAPVCLEILVDDVPVALAHADLFRGDLARADIGNGRHAFHVMLPTPLTPEMAHLVSVRRAIDGVRLGQFARCHVSAPQQ